jgi:hypothetical protein
LAGLYRWRRWESVEPATSRRDEGRKDQRRLQDVEPLPFDTVTRVLDRCFVFRLDRQGRQPLNEVELLGDSLMNNDGVLCGINVIRFVPYRSAVTLSSGDKIRLPATEFARHFTAFFAEIERMSWDVVPEARVERSGRRCAEECAQECKRKSLLVIPFMLPSDPLPAVGACGVHGPSGNGPVGRWPG